MFCTGGIRCEKASSYISSIADEDEDNRGVFQLQGGILKYLETHNESWKGDCFVFDQRVAVGPGLIPGKYTSCFVCRKPVSIAPDKQPDPHYVPGISCSNCYDEVDAVKRERFRERQKQIELAKQRGVTHLGSKDVSSRGRIKRRQKQKKLSGNCLRQSETPLS